MAGEHYAKQVVRMRHPRHLDQVDIWLDGTQRFVAVLNNSNLPGTFPIVGGNSTSAYFATATQFIAAVQRRIADIGLPFAVYGPNATSEGDIFDITFEATIHGPQVNFRPILQQSSGPWPTWTEVSTLTDGSPIFASYQVTPTGIFGSTDGAIRITASIAGYPSPNLTYTWSDGTTGQNRTNLAAGTYVCVVRNVDTNVTTTVTAIVLSDARLDVVVDRSENNVTLRVSGGVAPYSFLWSDGITTATRTELAPGDYQCTVSDSRGATRVVRFTIETYRFYWSGNPITLSLDAGDAYRADPGGKPNLTFLCEVYLEQDYLSDIFERVGTVLEQPADRDGRTTFEVQELLDVYLAYQVFPPNSPVTYRATGQFRRFQLRYAEKFGTPAVAGPVTSLIENYVVRGGLNFYESRAGTWFNSYQAGAKPFLTWEPNNKLVAADQPEFLYYMVDSFAQTEMRQVVRVTFADGAVQTFSPSGWGPVRRYEVFGLPCGYQMLGLGNYGKPVLHWDIYVHDQNEVRVSEIRRFVLDTAYYPQRYYLLFATSLGGMATLAVTGEAQLDGEFSGDELALSLAPNYDPELGDTAVLDRSLRPVLKLASGFRTRQQMAAATDFLLSRQVLLLRDGRWVAGTVKPKTQTLADDGKAGNLTLEFDFLLPRERFYTPALPATSNGEPVTGVTSARLL